MIAHPDNGLAAPSPLTVTYSATTNYNGSDAISVVTTDNGQTGTGGIQSDSDSISITHCARSIGPGDIVSQTRLRPWLASMDASCRWKDGITRRHWPCCKEPRMPRPIRKSQPCSP